MGVKTGTAITKFKDYFEQTKDRKDIEKPISWALYQTWKWADAYEKPRRTRNV
jgi:hypothetical protein